MTKITLDQLQQLEDSVGTNNSQHKRESIFTLPTDLVGPEALIRNYIIENLRCRCELPKKSQNIKID